MSKNPREWPGWVQWGVGLAALFICTFASSIIGSVFTAGKDANRMDNLETRQGKIELRQEKDHDSITTMGAQVEEMHEWMREDHKTRIANRNYLIPSPTIQ